MLWYKEETEIVELAKKKKHNIELQKFIIQLSKVSNGIKEACFRRWINACKARHALAFFQWRDKFSVKSNAGLLNAIFLNRIKNLKKESMIKTKILLEEGATEIKQAEE